MTEPTDIVAELDHWIRGSVQADPVLVLQRARDEIAALRQAKAELSDHILRVLSRDELQHWMLMKADVRAEALEEAALVCIVSGHERLADAIRALKEKP